MTNYILGSRIIQSILPTIIKENLDVAIFFGILSYVLFLINWLVTTDWIEKLHLFSGATCAIGGEYYIISCCVIYCIVLVNKLLYRTV